jgi:hypothetical protein
VAKVLGNTSAAFSFLFDTKAQCAFERAYVPECVSPPCFAERLREVNGRSSNYFFSSSYP